LIDDNCANQAAHTESNGLRGAPDAHPCAFAGCLALAGEAEHRAHGGDGKDAVGDAQAEYIGAQWPGAAGRCCGRKAGEHHGGTDTAGDDPQFQVRAIALGIGAAARTGDNHAEQNPAMLQAGELGGLTRCHFENQAGERLHDQVLHAVGEHRDKDEIGKPPGLLLLPDLGQDGFEIISRFVRLRLIDSDEAIFHSAQCQHRQTERPERNQAADNGKSGFRKRVKIGARYAGSDNNTRNHHRPADRGGGGLSFHRDPRRQ